MSNWTATNELRFVERKIKSRRKRYEGDNNIPYTTKTFLQQKWQSDEKRPFYNCFMTEWRDVSVVEEE
jgi:hypothetical protein